MSSSCPLCSSKQIKVLKTRTQLGYARFYCSSCRKRFNERTNTPFNLLQVPTDIMFLVIRWRLLYKLSLRDLSDMFLERGLLFSHEIIRQWERKFAPLIINVLRKKRCGKSEPSWYVDETYVKVAGKWCYLYRAIDKTGDLVDCRLSEKRNFEEAEEFFKSALELSDKPSEKVTTDKHQSYPRSIEEVLGKDVKH
jgi:putative transposase